MFSVWTLSSLILSGSLAFPIFTNSSGSQMETFLNVTERNSTLQTNQTLSSEVMIQKKVSRLIRKFMCPLSTCSLVRLGSYLQAGEESAGDSTHDPWGIGKK